MALIECSECGAKVSDRATRCPHCGNRKSVAGIVFLWVFIVLVVVVFVMAIVSRQKADRLHREVEELTHRR